MMGRFGHIADVHLGFQKSAPLQELERRAFEGVIDGCIARDVDFVLVCGDLFHVNIPEMRVQKLAMRKFRDLHEAGIPAYTVYGSHDFSPVSNSAIDLLESSGYLTKVTNATRRDGHIHLDFLQDVKTGAKLTGLSGLKAGRDSEHYRVLDRPPLESEPGFKVFLFHGAISEMTGDIRDDTSILAVSLPAGFHYYAGGHIHAFRRESFPGRPNVVYPGTPFAGYHSDMEMSARGERRGFVVVDFDDDRVTGVELVDAPGCGYHLAEIDAEGKSSEDVGKELAGAVRGLGDLSGMVVMLKIAGEMSSGRMADIDLIGARRALAGMGAVDVMIDRHGLASKEYSIRGETGASKEEVERRTFRANIKHVRTKHPRLTGSAGVALAEALLTGLRQPRPDNEKAKDYEHRVTSDALARMGLGEEPANTGQPPRQTARLEFP